MVDEELLILGTYNKHSQPYEAVFVIVPHRDTSHFALAPAPPPKPHPPVQRSTQRKINKKNRTGRAQRIVAYGYSRGSQRKRCSHGIKNAVHIRTVGEMNTVNTKRSAYETTPKIHRNQQDLLGQVSRLPARQT